MRAAAAVQSDGHAAGASGSARELDRAVAVHVGQHDDKVDAPDQGSELRAAASADATRVEAQLVPEMLRAAPIGALATLESTDDADAHATAQARSRVSSVTSMDCSISVSSSSSPSGQGPKPASTLMCPASGSTTSLLPQAAASLRARRRPR